MYTVDTKTLNAILNNSAHQVLEMYTHTILYAVINLASRAMEYLSYEVLELWVLELWGSQAMRYLSYGVFKLWGTRAMGYSSYGVFEL